MLYWFNAQLPYTYSQLIYIICLCIVFPSTDQLVNSKNVEDADCNHSNKPELEIIEPTVWWQWSDSPVTSPRSEELSQSISRITYPKIISTKVLNDGKVYMCKEVVKYLVE